MQVEIKKLQDELATIATQIQSIRDKWGDDFAKSMTPDEEERFDKAIADYDEKSAQLKRLEVAKSAEDLLKNSVTDNPVRAAAPTDEKKAAMHTLGTFFKGGKQALQSLGQEYKAYQIDDPTGGGNFLLPLQLVNEVLEPARNAFPLLNNAQTYTINGAHSLGIVSLDTDFADSTWTSEIASVTEDTTGAFGRRMLTPNMLSKLVRMSMLLLSNSPQAASTILSRLTYIHQQTMEKAGMTGTGSGQWLGVFTPSAQGISTGRNVTAASASALAGDDFIRVKGALKANYWNTARWILHRDVFTAARRLKDTTNNYLWAPLGPGGGLNGFTPATLCDSPYDISEYAPSTISTGQYVAILGDFRYYAIAQSTQIGLQRLDERYADTSQVGFIMRTHSDGMPTLEEAYSRLIMA